MEERLRAAAETFENWLTSFRELARRQDTREEELPHFPVQELLTELQEAAFGMLRSGGDPVTAVGRLVRLCREHNAKIVAELEKYAGTRGEITVEKVGLLRRTYLAGFETEIRHLLFRLRLAAALIRFRAAEGLSLRELERLSGVSASYLSQIERGISGMPSPEVVAQLDAVLVTAGDARESLVRMLNRSEAGLQTVREEAVRLAGILHRLVGGRTPDETLRQRVGREPARREALLASGSLSVGRYALPSARMRTFAKGPVEDEITGVCDVYGLAQELDLGDVTRRPVEDGITGVCDSGVFYEGVPDELYDLYNAVSRLNPELQRALLRLVKEMLRVQESALRKPKRGGEGQED